MVTWCCARVSALAADAQRQFLWRWLTPHRGVSLRSPRRSVEHEQTALLRLQRLGRDRRCHVQKCPAVLRAGQRRPQLRRRVPRSLRPPDQLDSGTVRNEPSHRTAPLRLAAAFAGDGQRLLCGVLPHRDGDDAHPAEARAVDYVWPRAGRGRWHYGRRVVDSSLACALSAGADTNQRPNKPTFQRDDCSSRGVLCQNGPVVPVSMSSSYLH